MAKSRLGKNTLPLLAITALLLSVALVNYDQSLVSNINSSQSVLSESDENNEVRNENREPERVEERKVETQKVETRKNTRLENEVKRKETETPKFRPAPIKIEDSQDDELEVEDDQNEEDESTPDAQLNRFKLKVSTVTEKGKTTIETESGDIEVNKNPDDVINDLVDSGEIDNPMTLEAKQNEREKVEYEIQGTESKKFLGIFNVVIPKTLTVSSETGEVISTNQNVWSRILSLLSN